MDKIWLYVILGVLAVVVTAVRGMNANKVLKEKKAEENVREDALREKAASMEHNDDAHYDASFSSGSVVAKLDKAQRRLLIATPEQNTELSLSDIASVDFEDRSEDYKHCQEMARLRKGVERHSLYNPYGKYSMREVKEGAMKLDSYTGRVVYGASVRCKNGSVVSVPAYLGNGALLWDEDQRMNKFKDFLEEVKKAL